MWDKKVSYSCRKDVADKRVRVKGRFVRKEKEEHIDQCISNEQSQKSLGSQEDFALKYTKI